MKKKEEKTRKKIFYILDDIVYYVVLLPLIIISLIIVYKSLRYPEKIPDIFGYKMFMVMDNNMNEAIEYGDLIFTKNVVVENVEQNDLVAVRTNENNVIIYNAIRSR